MPNRLADSTSPYLLQHRDNPVDWWPWGPEAFAEARRRDVPILLSVGYAACHWCHVMAHESFEDEATAATLNEYFVEHQGRPRGAPRRGRGLHGGHPGAHRERRLADDLLPRPRRPGLLRGHLLPAPARPGMPSFRQLLASVTDAWATRRGDVEDAAARIQASLSERTLVSALGSEPVDDDTVATAVAHLAASFDPRAAGFGGAPKFPPSMVLEFLLRHHAAARSNARDDGGALAMVAATCEAMARGGMYDQLGGGFARYSVDAGWVVPHFEKMLYDNALLLRVYLHWWRATGDGLAQRVVRETAAFLLRDLRTPEGGFASALDADSEGREGAFYVWTPQQLRESLGEEDAAWVAALCDVTVHGSFEHGSSVLQLRRDPDDVARWERLRTRLLEARATRPVPARDDKVVAAWNGLAVAALAEAGALLGEPAWVGAAMAAADLLVAVHLGAADPGDGSLGDRLVRVSRDGVAGTHTAGVLEDHADVAEGLLALYQVTGDDEWLAFAGILCDVVVQHFWDGEAFHDTADDAEALVRRPQDPTDSATPSGWSASLGALLTYASLTGSEEHRAVAERGLGVIAALARRYPRSAGWGLAVAEAWLDGPREVAVVGDPLDPRTGELRDVALRGTSPGMVLAVGAPDEAGDESPVGVGLLAGRTATGGPRAYVCRRFVCAAPTSDPGVLATAVGARPPTANMGDLDV